MRPDPLRHPLIFYLGHTAAFYMNKLISSRILKTSERIDSEIESLVAIGVDEMSWYVPYHHNHLNSTIYFIR
jgi:hypothetical protein